MLDKLFRLLFEIQISLVALLIRWAWVICVNKSDDELYGELMSPTTSPFSESMHDWILFP